MTKQPVPPPSRARFWAARLALLVACVGSVATSYSFDASAEYEEPPQRLTPEQPTLTRTLVAQVSVDEEFDVTTSLSLMTSLTVTWAPSDPARQDKPKLRVKLRARDAANAGPGEFREADITQSPQTVDLFNTLSFTQSDPDFEQFLDLSVELLPGAPPGTLEVAWKAKAQANTSAALASPEAYKLQLTVR